MCGPTIYGHPQMANCAVYSRLTTERQTGMSASSPPPPPPNRMKVQVSRNESYLRDLTSHSAITVPSHYTNNSALEVHQQCPGSTPTVLWKYTNSALEVHRQCPGSTPIVPWKYTDSALEVHQ
ncbi:hypothetical protein Btru_070323 [Bulinus truncatus]|nr:hypothetical protein Btru_070323 [Bulinus truncatus]